MVSKIKYLSFNMLDNSYDIQHKHFMEIMTYLTGLAFLLLLQYSQAEYSCEGSWKLIGDTCIQLFSSEDNKTTWHAARDKCHEVNATLLTIRTPEKQALLAPRFRGDVWIDLTRDSSSDMFTWANGPPELNYTNWQSGEPNNAGEDCAVLLTNNQKGLWNDQPCDSHYHYICEAAPSGTHVCEPGRILLAGKCFSFSQNMTDWFKAREICQRGGGDLVTIPDAHWNELITGKQHEINPHKGRTHWIGASDLKSEGVWKWLDQPQEMKYENWADNAPDNGNSIGFHTCVYIEDGAWKTSQCRVFHHALCESSPHNNGTTSCANDWKLYQNESCIGMTDERASWDGSREKCKQLGGDLVAVKDKEKGAFVRDIVNSTRNTWIGLHDRVIDAKWAWLDLEGEAKYFEWALHHPMESMLRNLNCTFMRSTSTSIGRWANYYCSAEYGYICEAKGNCEPRWLRFNGYCYKFNYDICDWQQARKRCSMQDANADLVVIESRAEQLWLQDRIDTTTDVGGFWIGLNSNKQEKKFVWLNNTNLAKYSNWDARMPSYAQHEACVTATGQTMKASWKDEDCSLRKNYICEKPADGGASYYDFRYKSSVYKIIMSQFARDHGNEYCQNILGVNSTLIRIEDDKESNFIARELDAHGHTSNKTFWTAQTVKTAPDANAPSTSEAGLPEHSSRNCLEFSFTGFGPWGSRTYKHKLQPSVCCAEKYIICEKHIAQDKYKYDFALNTSIYRLVDEEVLEHDAAKKRCEELLDNSGSLAEFETTDELEAVSREVLARHLGEHFVYWVGGDSLDQISTNVTPKSELTQRDGHCLVLEYDPVKSKHKLDANMTLKSAPCTEKRKFLCEEKGIHIHIFSIANMVRYQWQKHVEDSSNTEDSSAVRPDCVGTCQGLAVALPFVVIAAVLVTVAYFWFIRRESPIPVRFRKLGTREEEVNLTL